MLRVYADDRISAITCYLFAAFSQTGGSYMYNVRVEIIHASLIRYNIFFQNHGSAIIYRSFSDVFIIKDLEVFKEILEFRCCNVRHAFSQDAVK